MKLIDRVHEYNRQTHDALQTVYDALNKGQRQKILKDKAVKALFQRFRVETEVQDG